MNNEDEMINNYKMRLRKEREEELTKNSSLIEAFIDFSKSRQIKLNIDNFDYVQTIGIIAHYPNIVHLLNEKISKDKEELVEVNVLEKEYKKESFAPGFYYAENYMVMAHPYFRRGYHDNSNFAPSFTDIFWGYEKNDIEKYIAIDSDRVRINVDNRMYMEFDTWYGAKFNNTISNIDNGVVKLRPPLGLEAFHLDFFFGSTYSLDIKWTSKDGVKVFQAEEFKIDDIRIIKNGNEYYPVRYLHAEFDKAKGTFRHFDGAIHFYTEDEYYQRRDDDLNYNSKNSFQLKTFSQKLFKVNGTITVEEWVKITSHYLTGNPLVYEYFEGKLPDDLIDIIDKLTANR